MPKALVFLFGFLLGLLSPLLPAFGSLGEHASDGDAFGMERLGGFFWRYPTLNTWNRFSSAIEADRSSIATTTETI